MKTNHQRGRVSGFTLLEMMVVIAIVGILSAVMVPTIMGYQRNSRLNSENANAKILFNSLQTVIQEYEFLDRNEAGTSDFYGTGAVKQGTILIRCQDGRITEFTNSSHTDSSTPPTPASITGTDCRTDAAATINARMSRLFPDYTNVNWVAFVKDYSVRGVLSAETMTTDYIGGYPLKATERGQASPSCVVSSIGAVTRADMVNYCKDSWNGENPEAW